MTFEPSDMLLHLFNENEGKVLVDGVEMTIPTEEELFASYEAEAARLEVTVDYYMDEFL